ncbi:MAG: VWA domain-containing protein [Anaerolineae bacterium]|nr:VWA domain-containing protein [Anaerolineae bacterium]
MTTLPENERLRRWRLVLGNRGGEGTGVSLSDADQGMDQALEALYGGQGNEKGSSKRQAGLGGSAPNVARWLGDIRSYFPASVVQVMQKDAIERLDLHQLLLEPEMLEAVQPDVHLVATLITLKSAIPDTTRATARMVVQKVVDELMRRLANPTRQAMRGSLNRSTRNMRPRHHEIDWKRTILRNLKHYLPEHRTIIPETLIGYGHKRSALREVVLCVDQSGSMASSVVYSSIFAAVMASVPAVKTSMVVFDTAVVDLTDELQDPVELLFGTQLGGGTDINKALAYCQSLIRSPRDTILILISDLYEGGNREEMLKRVGGLVSAGAQVIALLALDDQGAPMYDHRNAEAFASMGIPTFACTPELFPELMAAAINRQDISQWAARNNITTASQVKDGG